MTDTTPALRPANIIADVLFAVEDQGDTEAIALDVATDVIHALKVAGYAIVPAKSDPAVHARRQVAAELQARAAAIVETHGENDDYLAAAFWTRCGRHESATCGDPRTIAVAAYRAIAALLVDGPHDAPASAPPSDDRLQKYAAALRAAALACDGTCGLTEQECDDRAGITWAGTTRQGRPDEEYLVTGSTTAIADAFLAVRDDELAQLRAEIAHIRAENTRLRAIEHAVTPAPDGSDIMPIDPGEIPAAWHRPTPATEWHPCPVCAATRSSPPGCSDCTRREITACSNTTCCLWPCQVHLALHDETEQSCTHRHDAEAAT